MENPHAHPPDADESSTNVLPFRKPVPPLTDDEILRLRAILGRAERVLSECPVALRILSDD